MLYVNFVGGRFFFLSFYITSVGCDKNKKRKWLKGLGNRWDSFSVEDEEMYILLITLAQVPIASWVCFVAG